jgi:soluble lytic murein transglycosylase
LQASRYNDGVQRRWPWLLLLFLLLAGLLAYWRYHEWRDHRFDAVILAAARRYGVEPALVKAVVWRESWFNPTVRGRAGEIGLMQIRAPAATEWARAEKITAFAPEQLLDPGTNTLAGTWYLRKLLGRYRSTDNPLPYTLADYNAGRSHVLQWNAGAAATNSALFLDRIEFRSTRRSVGAVTRRYEYYRLIFPQRKS